MHARKARDARCGAFWFGRLLVTWLWVRGASCHTEQSKHLIGVRPPSEHCFSLQQHYNRVDPLTPSPRARGKRDAPRHDYCHKRKHKTWKRGCCCCSRGCLVVKEWPSSAAAFRGNCVGLYRLLRGGKSIPRNRASSRGEITWVSIILRGSTRGDAIP